MTRIWIIQEARHKIDTARRIRINRGNRSIFFILLNSAASWRREAAAWNP